MNKRGFLSSDILMYGLLVGIIAIVAVIGFGYISEQKAIEKDGTARASINKNGITVLKSADESAQIIIPKEAQTSATEAYIKSVNNPAIDSGMRASQIYQFGPAGAAFSAPLEIRIRYDPIITGDCPESINFHHYSEDGNLKEYVASKKIYCSSRIASFEIDSFSLGYAGKAARDEEEYNKGSLVTGNSITPITGRSITNPAIDSVNWIDTDVSGWEQTATLSGVAIRGDEICLEYDKANDWPPGFPLDSSTELIANAWIIVNKNGEWHASTWDWLRPGQKCKDTSNIGPDALRGELRSFHPTAGETYGFMVSGLARNSVRNVQERSNILMVQWTGTTGTGTSGEGDASCGQGIYFSKLEGFDLSKFNDCNQNSPKYKAARVFSNFEVPQINDAVLKKLNNAGLRATLASGTKDVINFDINDESGKKIGMIDVIKGIESNGIGQKWQWRPVNGASIASPGHGADERNADCNEPAGRIPEVHSVAPGAARAGDTITITGRDLTTTIQFYGNSGRYSYCGRRGCSDATISRDCGSVTFKIPNDLPSGQYEFKIYKARDKISNGKPITISGGSTLGAAGAACQNSNGQTFGISPYPKCVEEIDAYARCARQKDDVCLFAECRDVLWMVRNTNAALGCSQEFTYNGVPAATWRSWVENEAQDVLEACKDVCHPGYDPGCDKQPDSVDKDKLLQALENYWKNCISRKGISCVCSPNEPICVPFSRYIGRISTGNNCNGNTGSGAGSTGSTGTSSATGTGVVNTASPASSWSPRLTQNGWFPKISPDGRYVTYGFGENWVVDLQTGQERSMTIQNSQSFAGNWIKPDTYTFINSISDNAADRYEVKAGEWIARKTNENPNLVAGNIFAAADGHWASYIADAGNNNFRIAYDNAVLATGVGGALSISDDWVAHASTKDNQAIQVWRNKQRTATYNVQTALHSMSINKGYIAYGGYGPVHGINPQGQDIDLTVTPWRWENVGGIVFVNNQPWVYTITWNEAQSKGYLLLRPWGERNSIVIEAAAVSVHVVYVNSEFVVAYNDDKGSLKVVKIPANSQRVDLSNSNNGNNLVASSGTASADATPGWLGDLAFDTKNNRWLVVSTSNGVKGRVMGNDANPVTASFKIDGDEPGSMAPLAAYSPDADKYLVVWASYPSNSVSDLYGRFVLPDGNLGAKFRIAELSGPHVLNLGGERTASLKYDFKNRKFVFIWQDFSSPNPIHPVMATIDLEGKSSSLIDLRNQDGKTNWAPSIATNEDNNEYCAVYDQRNEGNFVVRKIDASTLTAGPETAANKVTTNVDITYNSADKKYLLIYDAGYETGVFGRILNSCNANDVNKEFLMLEKQGYSSVSSNPKSNTYAAIGQNGQDGGNSYSIVDSSGQILARVTLFSDGRNGNFLPVIRANTNDGTFAATSSKDYEVTRFVANIGFMSSGNNGQTSTPSYSQSSIIAQKGLGMGTFPDVAFHNGKLWLAVQQDGQLKLYNFAPDLSSQQVVSFPIYGGQAFPRLTVSGNVLWMAYRVGDNSANVMPESVKLWRSDTQTTEDLGGGLGNNPIALGNGYIAWQKEGKVQRRLLTGGQIVAVRDQLPTGISRVLPDGSVKMIDEDRTAIPNYADPSWAADMTAAEDNDNGVVYFFNNNVNTLARLWQGITTLSPKAAADGNGNYAIATWSDARGGNTVRVAVIKKGTLGQGANPLTANSGASNLPSPNHPILFGYYFADGKYGDYTSQVNGYTNLYIADQTIYDTSSDWKASMQQSLQRASSNNKNILLMLNENTKNDALDIAKPFWSQIKLIEVGHEPDWDRSTTESKINELKSLLSSKNLPSKPIGVTYASLNDAVNVQGLDWVGVEAYVPAPGSGNSQTNLNQLNSLITQAKSIVPPSKSIVLIMMAYDRNGQWPNMQTLKDLQEPVYMQAYNDQRVIGIAMFSYARPGGARDHPELNEVHQRIGQKILG